MQQHAVNILSTDPLPPPPLKGSTGQNSTFSEHSHVAYQSNGNYKMQQHCSQCFVRRAPLPRGVGLKLFQNMVMLDIELIGITKCSNMVVNILLRFYYIMKIIWVVSGKPGAIVIVYFRSILFHLPPYWIRLATINNSHLGIFLSIQP